MELALDLLLAQTIRVDSGSGNEAVFRWRKLDLPSSQNEKVKRTSITSSIFNVFFIVGLVELVFASLFANLLIFKHITKTLILNIF